MEEVTEKEERRREVRGGAANSHTHRWRTEEEEEMYPTRQEVEKSLSPTSLLVLCLLIAPK